MRIHLNTVRLLVMPMDPADQLRQALSGGSTKKALRFVLNLLSSTPYIGGVFSAAASAWSETEQDKVNRLPFIVQQLTDDRVTEIEGSLAQASNPTHVVAASLTFNPNTGEFIDGFNVSSLTDCGTLDFVVGFDGDLARYVFTCYGSGPVSIERVSETSVECESCFATRRQTKSPSRSSRSNQTTGCIARQPAATRVRGGNWAQV